MADLKGKLTDPKDHKTVEEGLKNALSKSTMAVGFENLVNTPALNYTPTGDPATDIEAVATGVETLTTDVNAIKAALRALGVNVFGS